MTQKHTPGPWSFWPHDENQTVRAADGIAVAYYVWERNARLIAAAPDMLALLIELVDIEGPMPGTSEWGDKARATIAKAEGRS